MACPMHSNLIMKTMTETETCMMELKLISLSRLAGTLKAQAVRSRMRRTPGMANLRDLDTLAQALDQEGLI